MYGTRLHGAWPAGTGSHTRRRKLPPYKEVEQRTLSLEVITKLLLCVQFTLCRFGMFAAQACGLTFPAFMQDFVKFLLPWSMHMAGQRHADLQVG